MQRQRDGSEQAHRGRDLGDPQHPLGYAGTVEDKINFLEYSSKVFVEGKAIVYLGVKTAHNKYNAIGKFDKPAQKKVWVMP